MAILDDALEEDILGGTPRRRATRRTSTPGLDADLGDLEDTGTWGPDPGPVEPPPATPAAYKSTMGGFDPRKLADPGHNTPKYSFGRFFGSLGHTPEIVAANWDKFVESDPRFKDWTFDGKDKIRYGGSGSAHADFEGATDRDVIIGASAGGMDLGWGDIGGGPAAATSVPIGSPASVMRAAGGYATGGSASPSAAVTWGPDPFASMGGGQKLKGGGWAPPGMAVDPSQLAGPEDTSGGAGGGGAADPTSLEAMIAKLIADRDAREASDTAWRDKMRTSVGRSIDEASAPIDENDPTMAAQRRAYSTEQDRAFAFGREQLAARGAAQGLPSGAIDASLQSSIENLASDKAGFSADLTGDRLKQKIAQLESAQTMGLGIMSADDENRLQSTITALKARLDKMGLDQTGQLGNRELDIRGSLGQGSLDNQRLSLDMSDRHFYDNLGYLIGNNAAGLDARVLEMIMGG